MTSGADSEGWAAAGRNGKRNHAQNGKPRAAAVAEQPMGMRKVSTVAPTTNPRANSSASYQKPRSRDATRQQSSRYGLLGGDDEFPSALTKEKSSDQLPSTTTPPSVFPNSSAPKKLSAQQAAIPDDTVEKLLAAARAMYQQNMGVKTAAKKFNVTVQGLRHFWDTNGGSEICRAPEPKAKATSGKSGTTSSPMLAAAAARPTSTGHACCWNDSDDDDDQWY